MLKAIFCQLLLVSNLGAAQTALAATNTAGCELMLENSIMALPTARATLIVSPLTRTNGVYVGDFKVKVFPYFFKNDWGRLAIDVPDKTLAAIKQGNPVNITGTSTSTKNGVVRPITITATPTDHDHGAVSLWFMVEGQKMIFNPRYRFGGNAMTTANTTPPKSIPFRQE